jgi:site-specific DNA-cytosine methylase
MRNFESIGFTATHGCENANKGPYFFWKSGGCDNALTINSWWHQNFIMEYEIITILRIAEATKTGYVEIHPGECFDAENPNSETRRGRKMTEKSNCLMAQNDTNFMKYEGPRIINLFGKKVRVLGIRRLTPTECSRLQTIPPWYRWECSDSQAYRMLGNGWTVEVIKHIFRFLPFEREA